MSRVNADMVPLVHDKLSFGFNGIKQDGIMPVVAVMFRGQAAASLLLPSAMLSSGTLALHF